MIRVSPLLPPFICLFFIYTLARYRTEGLGEGKPTVNYPDPGFQGNFIPAHGPAVAKLIEDRVEGRL
jgi:hypothetical protein